MKLRIILLLSFILLSSACSSNKAVELSSELLQQKILTEKLIEIGDDVIIVTSDNKKYEFKVKSIDEKKIYGDGVNILISDIIALETNQFSGGKTALLAGGVFVGYLILTTLAIAAALSGG